jgi:hypothetical protein
MLQAPDEPPLSCQLQGLFTIRCTNTVSTSHASPEEGPMFPGLLGFQGGGGLWSQEHILASVESSICPLLWFCDSVPSTRPWKPPDFFLGTSLRPWAWEMATQGRGTSQSSVQNIWPMAGTTVQTTWWGHSTVLTHHLLHRKERQENRIL